MNVEAYRHAERALWAAYGVADGPVERRVNLPRNGVSVRVMEVGEVGEGRPVLFLHGGPNAGSTWASLAPRLAGRRCLVLDRPGAGLSDPKPVDHRTVAGFADTLVVDVLDALGVERADLVASSFGSYVALRSAAAHPDRIGRVVHLGCPAFVQGFRTPLFMRLLMVPGFRRLLLLVPPTEAMGRSSMRQIGHGASLDADRIPQVFFDWYLALQRHTETFRHETALIAGVGGVAGFRPSLTLDDRLLESIEAPSCFVWGTEEPFGSQAVAERLVAAIPGARLELLPGGGHLPWLDDPERSGAIVEGFLAAGTAVPAFTPRRNPDPRPPV